MYFTQFKTVTEVKEAYRSISKILHPDLGGTHELFIQMQNEYEAKLKSLHGTYNTKDDAEKGKNKYQFDARIERDLMRILQALQGLRLPETIQICLQGTWIWVKGTLKNSYGHYPVRDNIGASLEALGLKLHSAKGEYYYRDAKNACHNHGKIMSYDRINARYRGTTFSNVGADQVN